MKKSKRFVALLLTMVVMHIFAIPAMAVGETIVEEGTFTWEGKEYKVVVTEDANGQRMTRINDQENTEEHIATTENGIITVISDVNGVVSEESVRIPDVVSESDVPATRAVGSRSAEYRNYYYYWDNSTLDTYGMYWWLRSDEGSLTKHDQNNMTARDYAEKFKDKVDELYLQKQLLDEQNIATLAQLIIAAGAWTGGPGAALIGMLVQSGVIIEHARMINEAEVIADQADYYYLQFDALAW